MKPRWPRENPGRIITKFHASEKRLRTSKWSSDLKKKFLQERERKNRFYRKDLSSLSPSNNSFILRSPRNVPFISKMNGNLCFLMNFYKKEDFSFKSGDSLDVSRNFCFHSKNISIVRKKESTDKYRNRDDKSTGIKKFKITFKKNI